MPIYEFLCRDCDVRFDDLVSASAVATAACPTCTSADVVKLYSPFAVHSGGSSSSEGLASCASEGTRSGGCGGGAGCCGGGCC